MTDLAKAPSTWSVALARAAYGVMAVALIGPSLVSIGRVLVDRCRHVPNWDGGADNIVCATVDGWVAPALVAGALATAAARWVHSRELVPGMLASVGIVVGALPSFLPLFAVLVIATGLGAPVEPLPAVVAAAVAVFGLASGVILFRASERPWDRPDRDR